MKHCLSAVASMLVFVAIAPDARASLLDNGSFESPQLPRGSYCYTSAPPFPVPVCANPLDGWTGISVVIASGSAPWGGTLAQDGTQYVGLQSAQDANAGTITQHLSLAAGKYKLSWYDAGRGDVPSSLYGPATYQVTFNGEAVGGGTFQTRIGQPWRAQDAVFTAAGTGDLTFKVVVMDLDRTAFIDNISLSAVPEPAGFVMLLTGLGVVGLVRRPKRWKKSQLEALLWGGSSSAA